MRFIFLIIFIIGCTTVPIKKKNNNYECTEIEDNLCACKRPLIFSYTGFMAECSLVEGLLVIR